MTLFRYNKTITLPKECRPSKKAWAAATWVQVKNPGWLDCYMFFLNQLEHSIQLCTINVTRVEAGKVGVGRDVHDRVELRQVPLVAQLAGGADNSADFGVLEAVLDRSWADQLEDLGKLTSRLELAFVVHDHLVETLVDQQGLLGRAPGGSGNSDSRITGLGQVEEGHLDPVRGPADEDIVVRGQAQVQHGPIGGVIGLRDRRQGRPVEIGSHRVNLVIGYQNVLGIRAIKRPPHLTHD